MSAVRKVDAQRGESTSPGLSSPPSPNSPTGHSHNNAPSSALNVQGDGNDGGVKSGKPIGAKNANATAPLRKPRKKKDPESKPTISHTTNNHNGNGNGNGNNIHTLNKNNNNHLNDNDDGNNNNSNNKNNQSNNNKNGGNISTPTATATATDIQEEEEQQQQQQQQKTKKTRAARGTSDHFKRKQQKQIVQKEPQREAEVLQDSRQPKITDSLFPRSSPLPPPNQKVPAQSPHQNGNTEAIPTTQLPSNPNPNHNHNHNFLPTPTTRPASGQNYDPIRSSTVAPPSTSSPLISIPTTPKPQRYPIATSPPSIPSMIEQTSTPPAYSYPQPPPKREDDSKAASPPEPKRPRLSPPPPVTTQQPARSLPRDIAPAIPTTSDSNAIVVMDVDTDKPSAPINKATNLIKKPSPNASTTVSSSSHSPKPARPKEPQVAVASGSGLLSGSIFGGGMDSSGPEKTAPTVVLNVPLTGDNQYVNFTRLAEERYGFNALHPRLAAQRERLARVAAAGAALENANKSGGNSGSGDEMSVDLSDGEADNSNVEMGGVNDGERIPKSGEETGEAGAVKKPKKRTMKEDMYDKEDDFIDDTEMIWEEQAAASKDGFFVYSGPLVPPGQEPQVERYVPAL